MKDLLEALAIFASKYPDLYSPFHCEHDTLTVMCDPAQFTEEEITKLESLGFFIPQDLAEDCFQSFRFGRA